MYKSNFFSTTGFLSIGGLSKNVFKLRKVASHLSSHSKLLDYFTSFTIGLVFPASFRRNLEREVSLPINC